VCEGSIFQVMFVLMSCVLLLVDPWADDSCMIN